MSKAVVYGKPTCPFCVKAKQLLAEKGVEITEVIVGPTFTKDDLIKELGREVSTVPQIVLDGQYIGGYSDLAAHYGV